jgi:hypothetical protein
VLVPTTSVSLIPLQDLAQIFSISQNVFEFFVSEPLHIKPTDASEFKFSIQRPAIEAASYKSAISRYITQFDYYPQIDSFLSSARNLPLLLRENGFVLQKTEVVVIGREQFMWDEDGEECVITGIYKDDGWTALFDDRLDGSATHGNVCLVSLEKFFIDEAGLSEPLVRELNLDGYPPSMQRQLAERVYLAHNISYFLLYRIFHGTSVGRGHQRDCIMDTNYEGGLGNNLAANKVCSSCSEKFRAASLSPETSAFFSADAVVAACQCLTRSVQRIIKIEHFAKRVRKVAYTLLSIVAVGLIISVVASVDYSPKDGVLTGFYKALMVKPPILAILIVKITFCAILVLGLCNVLCSWVTRSSKEDI